MSDELFLEVGKCNICGEDQFTKVADKLRTGENYKIYKCTNCDHVQLLPLPTIEEDREYYNEDQQEKAIRSDVNISELRKNGKADMTRRAEFINNKFSKDLTILDIGCGYGFFLEEMLQKDYDIAGVEVSRERRYIAKKNTGCKIFNTNFIDDDDPDIGQYDIVTLFHVLEHIADPIQFVRNISKTIKNNGFLLLEVPNVDELMLETCQAYNEFYWIRAHLSYFSAQTLSTVLNKAGFENIEIGYVQRYGIENLTNWLMTGKPQLKAPMFNIEESYQWLEKYYREHLQQIGRTDAIFVVASKSDSC